MPRTQKLSSLFHLPRRTVQMQLALLYGGLFLASAVALLALTTFFVHTGVGSSRPAPGSVPALPGPNPVSQDVHQVVISSAVALAIMGVFSFALGWLVAGRLLQPMRTITAAARDISASSLHPRLDLDGPDDEFKELGRTLDDLFGRLEASFEAQRHFVANASHELRTPLTAERSLLRVTLADPDASAETWRSTGEELLQLGDQQGRLIEALLTLATSEGGAQDRQLVDLAKVAQNVVLVRQHEAERQGLHFGTALTEAQAVGDPNLVEILVANLVDNALRHNVPRGRVEISTKTTAGRAVISVSNTGTVIPLEEVDHLFQPFHQIGNQRIGQDDGHGLGLAIVQAIASAHGAALAARARPDGGLDIDVTFQN